MHIRSKDTVVVITGKDKGKEGKVLVASPKTGKVVVEGVAIATKHQKPRQQGVPGGIVKKEAAIDASNLALNHVEIPSDNGILSSKPELTMQNIATVSVKGMDHTDNVILQLMLNRT